MKQALSFDDVLITPQFSTIKSRADVNVRTRVAEKDLEIGIISSNMDSVTGVAMANAIRDTGGIGMLHRFWNIDDNVNAWSKSPSSTWVSIGVGNAELERAQALYAAGARWFVLDVAHGAAMHVVQQTKMLSMALPEAEFVVGNFATGKSILDFNYHLGFEVSAYKCNVGSGSACITRKVTGCGLPSFTSLQDCVSTGLDIIQDGGIKNSGDYAKAMGLGAKACVFGGLLAGCTESPTEIIIKTEYNADGYSRYKSYRGSASLESYEVQGKVAEHRTPEGEAFLVPYRGPVKGVVQELESGLRSAMSYVGATNLTEFKKRCEFVQVTNNGFKESSAHGRKE